MTLTKRQRQILFLMREADGPALFGASRNRGFGHMPVAEQGGVLILGYQQPEHFLKARGLIEPVERNMAGRWYRLSPEGAAAAAKIPAMPR